MEQVVVVQLLPEDAVTGEHDAAGVEAATVWQADTPPVPAVQVFTPSHAFWHCVAVPTVYGDAVDLATVVQELVLAQALKAVYVQVTAGPA